MSITEGRLNRADFLKAGAAGALSLTLARPAFARTIRIDGTTLNMLTWSDHYANDQLKAVSKATQIQGRPTLFSDNADAYLKNLNLPSESAKRPIGMTTPSTITPNGWFPTGTSFRSPMEIGVRSRTMSKPSNSFASS